MSKIIITNDNFDKEVMQADTAVLVDFWAEWCGPCRMVNPILDDIASEYEGRIKMAKVKVDDNQPLAQKYGVMSIPTFIIFKKGEQADQFVGALPKESFVKRIEAVLDNGSK